MIILVNAYNLRIGGGLTVGAEFIRHLYVLSFKDVFHVYVPDHPAYKEFRSLGNIFIHTVPAWRTNTLFGRSLINNYLERQCKKKDVNAVLSLGNYALPVDYKQVLLVQWPYAAYPESEIWSMMSLKNYIVRKIRLYRLKRDLKYAHHIVVQTEVMKRRLEKALSPNSPIAVVPSAISPRLQNTARESAFLKGIPENRELFLCISEYYPHKNLKVLIKAAKILKKKESKALIVLTLSQSSKDSRHLLSEIEKEGVSDYIISVNKVSQSEAAALYKRCDYFILPTLLESFGIIYLEAQFFELPILTSDRDFARIINGSLATYFDPLSPDDIITKIEYVLANSEVVRELASQAKRELDQRPTWPEIIDKYLKLLTTA